MIIWKTLENGDTCRFHYDENGKLVKFVNETQVEIVNGYLSHLEDYVLESACCEQNG